jgi:DNA-binding NtrC family response regulator
VIYIENRFQKQIVPTERLRLLEAFSAQAAQAIANARLHDALLQRSEELERSTREVAALNERLRDRVAEQDRELAEARRAIAEQQQQLEERYRFHHLIGSSEEMREVFRLLDRISDTELPVLIEGESGTGKELAARAIHYNSSRRRAPFVSENCGALSENLLESELFGHVKGAFTGADRDHPGLFASADGGTLFLDEVHQLSLGSQRKLLRVLQEGEYRPVGGKEVLRTDVRILAASNEPLYDLVKEGRFREDLYYRLNVLRVELPSLRSRGRDVLILAQHFLDRVVETQKLGARQFSAEALRVLARYPFPGNVRELRNIVEKAAILGEGPVIGEGDLLFDSPGWQPGESVELPSALTGIPLREAREEFQRRYIERILDEAGGVVSHAADRSGITRESLHRLIRKYGLRRGGIAPPRP